MKNIVIIGPPGSGKGTISLELKKRGYIHISTGDLLREEVASDSELGREIATRINNGLMVDDTLSLKLMKKAMTKQKSGYIFDGYPRNLVQAKLLEDNLITGDKEDLVILYLDIDLSILKDRIVNRLNCTSCGAIFNLIDTPPLVQHSKYFCTCCLFELKKRQDDTEDSLLTRIEIFNEKTKPVVEYYSSFNNFHKIDTSLSREEIIKNVLDVIS